MRWLAARPSSPHDGSGAATPPNFSAPTSSRRRTWSSYASKSPAPTRLMWRRRASSYVAAMAIYGELTPLQWIPAKKQATNDGDTPHFFQKIGHSLPTTERSCQCDILNPSEHKKFNLVTSWRQPGVEE